MKLPRVYLFVGCHNDREQGKEKVMLKFLGGTVGVIFLIGLLVVIGILAMIF